MYCTACGAHNQDAARFCANCGRSLGEVQAEATGQGLHGDLSAARPVVQDVPTYLVQAILATIFCCLPFGIVAIVFAAQVNGKLQAGDMDGALDASRYAKLWTWVAFLSGMGILLLYAYGIAVGFGLGWYDN